MPLFFGVLILLVVAAIIVKSVAFRVVVGVLVTAALVLIVIQQRSTHQENEESLTRIRAAELQLTDVVLNPGYANSFRIAGRVVNRSPAHTLTGLTFRVTIEDCPLQPPQAVCVTLGEGRAAITPNAPPGHARDFDEQLTFGKGSPAVRGRLKWSYVIETIRAK